MVSHGIFFFFFAELFMFRNIVDSSVTRHLLNPYKKEDMNGFSLAKFPFETSLSPLVGVRLFNSIFVVCLTSISV